MSATYKSLLSGGIEFRSAQTRAGRESAALPREMADEPTARVKLLPALRPAPGIAREEQVGRALVRLRGGACGERIKAARELGDIALKGGTRLPEAVVPLSVTLRSDPDAAVRQEAAWSLWKLADDRAHRPLIAALVGDTSTRVRERAARALGLLGVRDAAPVMTDLLSVGRHLPARLRAALVAALGFLAEEEALPLIVRATEDADPAVRCEAVGALGRFLVGVEKPIAAFAFRRLERHVHPRKEPRGNIRRAAVKALRLSPEKRANAAVCRAARVDPDPENREAAAEALLLWNSHGSEVALIAALADDVWQVRKAAARTLARSVMRHGIHDSAAVCEALSRTVRMFPSFSCEHRLAQEALASL